MALGTKEKEVLTAVNSVASSVRNVRTGVVAPAFNRLNEIGSTVVKQRMEEALTTLAQLEATFLELDSIIRDIERIN